MKIRRVDVLVAAFELRDSFFKPGDFSCQLSQVQLWLGLDKSVLVQGMLGVDIGVSLTKSCES